MSESGRKSMRFVPTLTEVVAPGVALAPSPAPTQAQVQALVERVMQRLELALQARVREIVTEMVSEQVQALEPLLLSELQRLARDAVTQEVADLEASRTL